MKKNIWLSEVCGVRSQTKMHGVLVGMLAVLPTCGLALTGCSDPSLQRLE